MRKGKLLTLLSAVLLGLASSCGNDYGKLAMTVNEMEGFKLACGPAVKAAGMNSYLPYL